MKKINKRQIIFILTLFLIVCVFWFIKKDNQDSKIGVIAPLTGFLSTFGEDIRRGVSSETGDGSIIFEDDACDPTKAVSAFNKLTNLDKVKIIIGPACGSSQEAIVPILRDKDVIVISPTAASENLYEKSGGKFFNIQYSLESEAKFLAESVLKKNHNKIVLIKYKNAFSETTANSFKEAFVGGNIVSEVVFTDSTSDISTEISKLKNIEFDAIVSSDISFFFAQANKELSQYGINVPIYSFYGTELPVVREYVEGVFYSYPATLDVEGGATRQLSRDGAELANKAIKSCGDDISCIKDYLIQTKMFDEYGASNRPLVLKQIKEGNPVVVE